MGLLIDASVQIEEERGRLDLTRYLVGRPADEVFLSVITVSELLHGVHRAHDERMRNRRSAWVEETLSRSPLLQVGIDIARTHARISAELALQGTPIDPHDVWLAATCSAHGLTVATASVRDFERVTGLEIQSWPNPS